MAYNFNYRSRIVISSGYDDEFSIHFPYWPPLVSAVRRFARFNRIQRCWEVRTPNLNPLVTEIVTTGFLSLRFYRLVWETGYAADHRIDEMDVSINEGWRNLSIVHLFGVYTSQIASSPFLLMGWPHLEVFGFSKEELEPTNFPYDMYGAIRIDSTALGPVTTAQVHSILEGLRGYLLFTAPPYPLSSPALNTLEARPITPTLPNISPPSAEVRTPRRTLGNPGKIR